LANNIASNVIAIAGSSRNVIIIDSDGGVDDLLCLVMASRLAANEIEGITAVYGNVSVDQALSNIIYSLALVNPPVKPLLGLGAKEALDGFGKAATAIHGPDGLGGARAIRPQNTSASNVVSLHAFAETISKRLDQLQQKVDLLGVGPATNIQYLIDKLGFRRINRIVLMSGVFFDYGNITNWAEFNAYNDPQALAGVLASGIPLTLVPLDLCQKVLLTSDQINAFAAAAFVEGLPVAAALREYAKAFERWEGVKGCFPHDAVALLVMLRPDQFFLVDAEVSVDVNAESRGRTRLKTIGGSRVNARVALGGRLRWARWMIETGWLLERPTVFSDPVD
jgi:inosine-uridine nucleoside N-ribohydrolase